MLTNQDDQLQSMSAGNKKVLTINQYKEKNRFAPYTYKSSSQKKTNREEELNTPSAETNYGITTIFSYLLFFYLYNILQFQLEIEVTLIPHHL